MKIAISLAILFCATLSLAKTPFADFRPRQMQKNSKLLIHFDNPQIFTEEGLVWREKMTDGYKECGIEIHSYYDDSLAKSTKTAVYYIYGIQGQSSLYKEENGYFNQNDDFIYWLSTENKNLPLLSFYCRSRTKPHAQKSFFTLADVENFTGYDDIFLDPIYNENKPSPSISQMIPKKLTLKTLVDLSFSSKKRSNGIGIDIPYFTDGRPTKDNERAACNVNYDWKSESATGDTFILPKGLKATLHEAHELGFMVSLDFHTAEGKEISLHCSSDDNGIDMDFVRHHMGHAVEITELAP